MKTIRFVVDVRVEGKAHHHALAREARLLLETAERKIHKVGWLVERGPFKRWRPAEAKIESIA